MEIKEFITELNTELKINDVNKTVKYVIEYDNYTKYYLADGVAVIRNGNGEITNKSNGYGLFGKEYATEHFTDSEMYLYLCDNEITADYITRLGSKVTANQLGSYTPNKTGLVIGCCLDFSDIEDINKTVKKNIGYLTRHKTILLYPKSKGQTAKALYHELNRYGVLFKVDLCLYNDTNTFLTGFDYSDLQGLEVYREISNTQNKINPLTGQAVTIESKPKLYSKYANWIETETKENKQTKETEITVKGINANALFEKLLTTEDFRVTEFGSKDDNTKAYYYDRQTHLYKRVELAVIRRWLKEQFITPEYVDKLNKITDITIFDKLHDFFNGKENSTPRELNGDKTIITFLNGVYSLEDKAFYTYEQYYNKYNKHPFITRHIQANYNAKAKCKRWDDVIKNSKADSDTLKTVYEMIGLVITGYSSADLKKYFMFYGDSNTGKSTIVKAVTCLTGKEYSHSFDLQKAIFREFRVDSIVKSVFAYSDDKTGCTITKQGCGFIKELVGGNDIEIERKFENVENSPLNSLICFCTNNTIKFDIFDNAIANRFLYINWDHIIPENKRDNTLHGDLELNKNGILDYIALQGVKAMQRLYDDYKRRKQWRITQGISSKQVEDKFKASQNTVYDFLINGDVVLSADNFNDRNKYAIDTNTLYTQYCIFMNGAETTLNSNSFKKELTNLQEFKESCIEKNIKIKGGSRRVFVGLRPREYCEGILIYYNNCWNEYRELRKPHTVQELIELKKRFEDISSVIHNLMYEDSKVYRKEGDEIITINEEYWYSSDITRNIARATIYNKTQHIYAKIFIDISKNG